MAGTALVTGAASGIGLAAARLFVSAGWRVAGLDREAVPVGSDIRHVQADVTDEVALRRAVEQAVAMVGGLDALVCSAGISGSSSGDGPVHASSGVAFDAIVGANLRGAFLTVSAAWSALADGGGAVVTVGSVLGVTGGGGPFRSHAYIVSKGGLATLTRALAAEGRAVGIRANCVAPGLVDTPMAARTSTDPAVLDYVADRQPLVGGGPIACDDVAAVIVFLCSAGARAVTGQVLAVDAGWGLDPA